MPIKKRKYYDRIDGYNKENYEQILFRVKKEYNFKKRIKQYCLENDISVSFFIYKTLMEKMKKG